MIRFFNTTQTTSHICFAVLVFILLILGYWGEFWNPILEFRRSLIDDGQVWRMLTAHFVHIGFYHTLLNLTGLVFWYWLFARFYPLKSWLTMIVGYAISVGVCLYLFADYLEGYAGYSGALHGLIVFSLLYEWRRDKINLVFAAIFIGKVIYEQLPDYDVNYLRDYMDAPVIVDAHLYGLIAGLLLAALFELKRAFDKKL